MSTEKMREEFEAWLASYESRREKNGWMPLEASIYVRMHEAWKASREAIEVELPRQHGVHYPRMFSDEVRTSIESLGLKVKWG